MKKRFRFCLLVCSTLIISACNLNVPLRYEKPSNNDTYTIDYLFQHDGVKVYRFYDMGNYVYFTTRGDATSIHGDSTQQRTFGKKGFNPFSNLVAHFFGDMEENL